MSTPDAKPVIFKAQCLGGPLDGETVDYSGDTSFARHVGGNEHMYTLLGICWHYRGIRVPCPCNDPEAHGGRP